MQLMAKYRISGIPVTKNKKLVGILTNRDLRFETRMDLKVSQVMKRDKLSHGAGRDQPRKGPRDPA